MQMTRWRQLMVGVALAGIAAIPLGFYGAVAQVVNVLTLVLIVGQVIAFVLGEINPELGRSLQHKEGVALITRYVLALQGACVEDDGPAEGTAR